MTTLYSATASLDGYIAGRDGDMSWLSSHLAEPNPTADELVGNVGCLLVGRRTLYGDDPNAGTDQEGPFGGRYDGPVVALSHHPPADPGEGVEFFSDVYAAVARSTELAGPKYVNVLGAETARSCLDAGLLDEVLIFIAPVMLGAGVRILDRPSGDPISLERREGSAEHWYRVVKP